MPARTTTLIATYVDDDLLKKFDNLPARRAGVPRANEMRKALEAWVDRQPRHVEEGTTTVPVKK